ncbi:hypothetical protein B566_EDAN004398 [Ephemera danica]|nr:hypothetical protein B566_EDAN004398 [Ephemera danica]
MSAGYVHDTAIAMLCSTTMESADTSNNDKLSSSSGSTRKRNRVAKPEQWNKNQKKKLREEGKEYEGVHIDEEGKAVYVKRPARELLERCKHTSPSDCDANADAKQFECYKITDTERELIKQKFYQLSWNERRVFIACNVVTVKAGTRSKCVYYLSCEKERREGKVFVNGYGPSQHLYLLTVFH